ncbi:MAG: DUF2914 domain-containing protein [bacterium]|jgi:hypothetical protein|nr:DUF2914 domain-containing protein [candidate division KSB1 bacterium]MDH7558690.1 DUF2914 domain-containing protein [bacterium]
MLNKLSYLFVALVALFVLCQIILPKNKTAGVRRARQEVRTESRTERERSEPSSSRGVSRSRLRVAEIAICRDIKELRPVGVDTRFSPQVGSLFCFTLIEGATGPQVVYHDWQYEGRTQISVPLSVEDQRWRTWSKKAIRPDQVGTWKVEVRDGAGRLLGEARFEVTRSGR